MIHYVSGDDEFNKNKFISDLCQGKTIIEYSMTTNSLDSMLNEILSIKLFDTNNIYVINDLKVFTNKSEKLSKANRAMLSKILNSNEEIIISTTKLINEQTSWYKTFKDKMQIKVFNLENLDYDQALNKYISDNNINIEEDALLQLKNNLANNIFAATNDLNKMWNYCNKTIITLDVVNVAGQKIEEHKIFELFTYLVQGKTQHGFKYLETLRLEGIKDSDILLVSFTQFKKMYEVKLLISKAYNDFKIANALKMNVYAVKHNRKVLEYVSLHTLEQLIERVALYDFKFKSGLQEPQVLVDQLMLNENTNIEN